MKDDEKRGETPRFLFAFLHASTSILRGFYDKDSLIAFKALLIKAERDHKSFVDLSHCAGGQIADFVF